MKKIISIILLVSMLATAVLMTGCESDKEDYENISKLENYHFVGESEKFIVVMKGGKKEDPGIIDGVSGKLIDYVDLTLIVKSGFGDSYSYYIGINEEELSGDFKEEIAGGNYHAEFSSKNLEEHPQSIKISYDDKSEMIDLVNVKSSEMMEWNEAKLIAKKELSTNIDAMKNDKNVGYETYVKLLYDREKKEAAWYVSYMNEKSMCAVIIDPITKKITAKRT